eukprot:CAMPEP_0197842594 /NCGR_PEP_ID=MMETSP1437-20131217/46824_1 /TAXON_ID=49252 ORGANISM="Eucampia antarctica, Strain CCMP1452" /NCGR_SAMPLE_ID=MMETSP1437 /ASSEMBLY_ACC=CAM_ASM_001096 /LENGTH=355 /DNA_ID=CAMNT_0043452485 /DNA_START=35 /DNA_END=1102 /DNA_ORIENTATION=-
MNLIKGYLPLPIKIPSTKENEFDASFVFLKEHIVRATDSSTGSKNAGKTLFVANAPFVSGVRTSTFLHAVFGKFGEVEKVVVVRNPRGGSDNNYISNDQKYVENPIEKLFQSEMSGVTLPIEDDFYDEGKFAHIIFSSSKEMKRTLKALKKQKDGVSFGRLEVQELADQSHQAWKKERSRISRKVNDNNDGDASDDDDDEDFNEDEGKKEEKLSGIMALVQRHRDQIIDRSVLSAACDSIMAKFEDAETEAEQKLRDSGNQPDEDGFVTVSYSASAAVETNDGLEKAQSFGVGRRKAGKRSRKRKEGMGKKELDDFYRFQTRESKKRNLSELKQQFQEDLERVKKMKEQKLYRPF